MSRLPYYPVSIQCYYPPQYATRKHPVYSVNVSCPVLKLVSRESMELSITAALIPQPDPVNSGNHSIAVIGGPVLICFPIDR